MEYGTERQRIPQHEILLGEQRELIDAIDLNWLNLLIVDRLLRLRLAVLSESTGYLYMWAHVRNKFSKKSKKQTRTVLFPRVKCVTSLRLS